jgi:hypothetical protein
MSDRTRVDVASAHIAAKRLTALANGLAQSWAASRTQISGLHAQRPWGNDEPGQEFDKNYSKGLSPDSPAAKALEVGDGLVTRLQKLGPLVRSAVDGVVTADELSAELIKQGPGSVPSKAV